MSNIQLYNQDCMEAMKQMPDKAFDLAIVDPPYGGGCNAGVGGRFAKYDYGGGATPESGYGSKIKHWDVAPTMTYFNELARVSKNQIIWGGNYFSLPPTRCFLVWRKLTISEGFSMAMCEYAWTSFNDNAKWIEIAPQGTKGKERFHPTQKPEKLYAWILRNYAKPGNKILDTHLGSGSIAIACHDMGFDLTGYEIDKDYYDSAVKRLDNHKLQLTLFTNPTVEEI